MNVTVGRGRGVVREVVLRAWQRSFFTLHFESNARASSQAVFKRLISPGNFSQLRIYRRFGECAGDRRA